MQKHGLHSGSLEAIKRLLNAQSNLRGLMGSGFATVDFRIDDKSRGSSNLAEADFRGTVAAGRVDMLVAAIVEYIQKVLDILFTVEGRKRLLGRIPDLSSSN